MSEVVLEIRLPPWHRGAFVATWSIISTELLVVASGHFLETTSQHVRLPPGEYWVRLQSMNENPETTHFTVLDRPDAYPILLYPGWRAGSRNGTPPPRGALPSDAASLPESVLDEVRVQVFTPTETGWSTVDIRGTGQWNPHRLAFELDPGPADSILYAVWITESNGEATIAIIPPLGAIQILLEQVGPRRVKNVSIVLKDSIAAGFADLLVSPRPSTWEVMSAFLEDIRFDATSPLSVVSAVYIVVEEQHDVDLLDRLRTLVEDITWLADAAILTAYVALLVLDGAGVDLARRYLDIAASRGLPVFRRGVGLFLDVCRMLEAMQEGSLPPLTRRVIDTYAAVRAAHIGANSHTIFSDPAFELPSTKLRDVFLKDSPSRALRDFLKGPIKSSQFTATELISIARAADVKVTDLITVPRRHAEYLAIPTTLHPSLLNVLSQENPHGLWAHQSRALTLASRGEDICLATPTASGKSLIFQAAAADVLLRSPTSRILAFYPVKALIHDQLSKWKDLLDPLGFCVRLIDGAVPIPSRLDLLQQGHVVLMTPDVAHAWMMSNLDHQGVVDFLKNLSLLILDEAHVYDGVFGTNMAFFIRRLQSVAAPFRVICSTATIENPTDAMRQITGRSVTLIGSVQDGSTSSEKIIVSVRASRGSLFRTGCAVLGACLRAGRGKFLAFANRRTTAELLVAYLHKQLQRAEQGPGEIALDIDEDSVAEELDDDPKTKDAIAAAAILPFRSGYENDDRVRIQESLRTGTLRGVVSTSALEMGLDIGDIDLVILIGYPVRMKEFWQRLGRTGRRHSGACLLIESKNYWTAGRRPLRDYVERPVESSALYLDNRYLQFANALCAANEYKAAEQRANFSHFETLPQLFREYLNNELNPAGPLPVLPEFELIRTRLKRSPQHAFALRGSVEPRFQVQTKGKKARGTLTYRQLLREAYPGAIYYYLAKPHRVEKVNRERCEVIVRRIAGGRTEPLFQAKVFPNFRSGFYRLRTSPRGFVSEVSLQVNERVSGFFESRGKTRMRHEYDQESIYSREHFCRFLETTGVCWSFEGSDFSHSEDVARKVLEAFCVCCGIEARDLGVGVFATSEGPFGFRVRQGVTIYDATFGSLRLTERLIDGFQEIARVAQDMIDEETAPMVAAGLRELHDLSSLIEQAELPPEQNSLIYDLRDDGGWITLIAPGERALYVPAAREVTVLGFNNKFGHLLYDLKEKRDVIHSVGVSQVLPLHGVTKLIRVNLNKVTETS